MLISFLKVLTFLRPAKNFFAILVQQLANHLKGKEVVLEAEQLTRSLTTVYGESLVMGKQYMFLRPGSKLTLFLPGDQLGSTLNLFMPVVSSYPSHLYKWNLVGSLSKVSTIYTYSTNA